jgi:hypothetical protein
VHERDRRPRAAGEVADAAGPAFVKIREDPFGFRHAQGIFSE